MSAVVQPQTKISPADPSPFLSPELTAAGELSQNLGCHGQRLRGFRERQTRSLESVDRSLIEADVTIFADQAAGQFSSNFAVRESAGLLSRGGPRN